MIKMMVSVFEMVMFHSYIKLAKGTLMFANFIHTLQAFFRLACPLQSFYPERVCGFVFAASQEFFLQLLFFGTHTHIYIYIQTYLMYLFPTMAKSIKHIMMPLLWITAAPASRYLKFADYMVSGIYAHRWVWPLAASFQDGPMLGQQGLMVWTCLKHMQRLDLNEFEQWGLQWGLPPINHLSIYIIFIEIQ